MATGNQADFEKRIAALIPPWFGSDRPLVDGLVAGAASVLAFIYSLWAYTKLQTRISTATDGWLDMIAADFFGTKLLRKSGQSDASYRNRILTNLIRERGTRVGLIKAIEIVTGRTPNVFEPQRPVDTGGYSAGGVGYGLAGGYGSELLPCQVFVEVYRKQTSGIPSIAGYGIPTGAYSTASQAEYASLSNLIDGTRDSDILTAINDVKPEGVAVWVRFSGSTPPLPDPLDYAFVLDSSVLM